MNSFAAIKKIVGECGFVPIDSFSNAEKRGTFIPDEYPIGILSPKSQTELIECITLFHSNQIEFYVVSCGKNWGLGGYLPKYKNRVCVDLSGLSKIINYDYKIGFIRVEPGVTFQQAYEFLESKKSQFMLSVIGGSPKGSLIGNALCRGDGTGVYGNRFWHTFNYKVLNKDGRVEHLNQVLNDNKILSHQRAGPLIQGLFSQSEDCIVLEMDIALAYKPAHLSITSFSFKNDELNIFLSKIKCLKNNRVIGSPFAIWNSYKAMAKSNVSEMNLKQGEIITDVLKQQHELNDWNGQVGLESGNERIGRELQNYLKSNLISTEWLIQELFSDIDEDEQLLKNSPYYGVPTTENLISAYWGIRSRIEGGGNNLIEDGVGFIWKCFLSSLENLNLQEDLSTIETLTLSAGFSPQIALLFIEDHVVNVLFSISFDRLNEKESLAANHLSDKLNVFFIEKEYPLFRKGLLD